jgi:hypothetical protein
MKIRTLLLGALVGAGAMIAMADSASAYVVCNRSGDCWHTDSRYTYPGAGFNAYPDDWYFHQRWDDHYRYRWRGDYHRDRGYYRGGVWIQF